MKLVGNIAIITGAGKGLGKVFAQKMFQEGALLGLWDIDKQLICKLAEELDPAGEKVIPVEVDIASEKMVDDGLGKVLKKFGRVDILVNNAGVSRHSPIEEMSVEEFERVVRVNLTGTFICCKAVTPVMKDQGRGKIINISSLGGRTGRPGVGVNYAASKAGVIGLTQTLARELGKDGIYANTICPGPILTEQTRQYSREVLNSWNVGRAIEKDGLPEDVAELVIFLASSRSDWITGATLDINGGIYIT